MEMGMSATSNSIRELENGREHVGLVHGVKDMAVR